MRFREELNLASIYMGVLMGAGFASGREIMSFFTVFGLKGFAGIFLASGLFFLSGFFLFRLSIMRQSSSVRGVFLPLAGEKLMTLFEIITLAFLFAGYYIMLAGCGTVFKDVFGMPLTLAAILFNLICLLGLIRGVQGLAAFNRALVPLMVGFMVLISYKSIKIAPNITPAQTHPGPPYPWYISSLLYASFNTTYTSVVISSLGKYTHRKKVALGAALIAATGVFITALLLGGATYLHYRELSGVEVPLLVLARKLGPGLYWAAVLVLVGAMLTTAIGFGFALVTGLMARFNIPYRVGLGGLLVCWPLATLGFARLIDTLYPLFGTLGIIFATMLIIRRFFCSGRE